MQRTASALAIALFLSVCGFAFQSQSGKRINAGDKPRRGLKPTVPQKKTAVAGRGAPARESAATLNNIAVGYINQQRFEQALPLLDKAIAAGLPLAILNKGIALLNLQRTKEAHEALTAFAQKEPRNTRAWYNLGLLHKNTGDAEQALTAFGKVTELDPADADSWYFVGAMHLQLKRPADAIPALKRAIELNPHHVSAEFSLARAFRALGNNELATRHLANSQQIQTKKLGAPISLVYGEQGPYSVAEQYRGAGTAAPAAIAVRFVRGTAAVPGGAQHNAACVLDADGDGDEDVFATLTTALYLNHDGQLQRQPVIAAGKLPTVACAVADVDNDNDPDLAVATMNGVKLLRNDRGQFADVTSVAGLKAKAEFVRFWDYDHDGDTDLFATAERGSALWRNNGDLTFTEVTAELGVGSAGSFPPIPTDLNNDRAIDFVTMAEGRLVAFMNPREGRFTTLQVSDSIPSAAAVADFDKDGFMDIAVASGASVTVLRNRAVSAFEAKAVAELPDTGCTLLLPVDYDNDGWIDLLYSCSGPENRRQQILRNTGSMRFEAKAPELQDKTAGVVLGASDIDDDGDVDLLSADNTGLAVVRNEGANTNAALRLSLKGLADNRAGIGTKVEVFAGDHWQKYEVVPQGGGGQSSLRLMAGIGKRKSVDVVRLLWPTGVPQDEMEVSTTKPALIEELDRRGSSCPVLFAWDGKGFSFVTDMIGAGIVGHWVAPGMRNTPDPTEYVRVTSAQLRERDGRLSLRLVEPMEEIVYLDEARLLAIDHPADTEVFPNERFMTSAASFPEFKIISARNPRPPRAAWDHHGRNVLHLLRAVDRRHVQDFELLPFKGFSKLHYVELELPERYAGGPLQMLLTGFTEYFTATSVYAAHQAKVTAIVPYVEALGQDGSWVKVVEEMGFPAGLRRTMTFDLTGKLPTGTTRIRIATNLLIYWDQILFATNAPLDSVSVSDLPVARAELGFLGFPRQVEGTPKSDLSFRYEQVSTTAPYVRHRGHYTRFGDVTALLQRTEDKFVIFGSGEEIRLEFDARALPPLAPGAKRTYFFFTHGYSKDMDFYEAHSDTVDPMPFRAMPAYPYPDDVSYPASHLDYLLEQNSRPVNGAPARLRFQYGGRVGLQ